SGNGDSLGLGLPCQKGKSRYYQVKFHRINKNGHSAGSFKCEVRLSAFLQVCRQNEFLSRFIIVLCTFKKQIAELINLESIPRIWKRAYFLLCLWYFINFTVSAILEWKLATPFAFVFWNALYLWEALCVSIILIFLYANFLFRFKIVVQVVAHVVGVMVFFLLMGTFSYSINDYVEGYVHWDNCEDHIVGLLTWDGLQFQNQYVMVVAVYYSIRYFEGLQRKEQERGELAVKN